MLFRSKFDNGIESYTRIVVIEAFYGGEGTPASYCVTLYRDANYQYIEILVKSNVGGESYTGCRMGPYNVDDVSVPQTLNSVVWRGNLLGNDWTFVGEGSVALSPRNTCSDLVCPTAAFKCLKTSKTCTCSKWKFFTAQCTKSQQALGQCSGTSGAWVPAITVCNQRLF